jgi:uncharacterized RDD family membrane protein YckC
MATRHVTEVGLALAPELLGVELASPRRRLLAFVVDAGLVLIPSLAVALLVAWVAISLREPAASAALSDLIMGRVETSEQLDRATRDLVPLLVKYEMPGTPAAAVVAYEDGDLDGAAEALADRDLVIVLNSGSSSPLEAGQTRVELDRLIPRGLRGLSFYGVAALYFSWLTSRRRGATLAKRWLGLRVTLLDGRPPGLVVSFERFFGYAQVPASLFTALLDFWRDPNRRLPHDRLAGTLVVRERRPRG